MKILLVYPKMPDTFWAMQHGNRAAGKKSTYPPLGLMTVGAMLPESWKKKLVDVNMQQLKDRDIQWADYVFLSAMNVQIESVDEIVAQCNRLDTPVVAGGTLFSHEYDRFPGIRHFVLNEAEITLPQFLADLEKGPEFVHRIYRTSEFANVEETPVPDYSLIDVRNYMYSIVQYSRGCPYMCDFCDVTALFGRRPRVKTPEQIIAELETIARQSVNSMVLFADDNLIGNKRHLKSQLLPALIRWRREKQIPFYFATQLTINLADDDELMQMLIEAGFRHVFIGIETPEEDGLLLTQKKQNLRRSIMDNIKKLHAAGFIIHGGFIVGLDTDKPDIFRIQEQFIQESGIPLPIVNILKAPPGTELYERMVKEDRLLKAFTFMEGDTNIRTKLDFHTLYSGFLQLVTNIYTPEPAYRRIIRFLEDYQSAKVEQPVPFRFSLREVLKGLMVFIRIGILYEERKYFWKLIFWSLKNKPKLLDQACLFAIAIRQMNQTYKNMRPALLEKITLHQDAVSTLEEQSEVVL